MHIAELKKALEKLRAALKESHSLIKQRESLEERLVRLRQEIEAKQLKYYHYKEGRPEKAHLLSQQLEKEIALQKKIEEEIKQIDFLLEEYGEDPEEALINLRTSLIKAILTKYPEAEGDYLKIKERLEEQKKFKQELEAFLARFKAFREHMEKGAQTQYAAKKRGILDYLFGRNPKVLLSQHITQAEKEAEELLRYLEPLKREPIYGDLHTFFCGFLEDARKPWNQSLYNEKFFELFEQFSSLWQKLQEEVRHINQAIQQQEIAINTWIERYSQHYDSN